MKFHLRRAVAALFVFVLGASTLAHAAAVSGQGTWESTLQGRSLDDNLSTAEAYYDTSLNITWLADANYAGTTMLWSEANTWVSSLNINGNTGWRLPTITDTGTSGCNYAYSGTDCGYNVNTATGEMAHMFYTTLGDKAYYNTSGWGPNLAEGLTNTGPFSNIQSSLYWSGTEAPGAVSAWYFNFGNGEQDASNKVSYYYAWAVHSGDVGAPLFASPVYLPVPAAAWLFGSGLVGLFGLARRSARPA